MRKIVAVEHLYEDMDRAIKVEWNLGKRCNFNCSYCSKDTHDNFSIFPEWKFLKQTVDTLASVKSKKIRVSLTGGEPTLCKDFIRLISYMKEQGISYVSITTNGALGLKYFSEAIEYLDNIVFSFHFEYYRREKVLENILATHRRYQEINAASGRPQKRMHVHLMMLPGFFEEAEEVMQFLAREKIMYVIRSIRPTYQKGEGGSFEMVRPFQTPGVVKTKGNQGADYSSDSGYYSSKEEDWLMSSMGKSNFPNVRTILEGDNNSCSVVEENVNSYISNKENQYNGWTCFSGIQSLWIGPTGEVFNANCRQRRLGSIEEGFSMPKDPVLCGRMFCTCAADLNTTKVKDFSYLTHTRMENFL